MRPGHRRPRASRAACARRRVGSDMSAHPTPGSAAPASAPATAPAQPLLSLQGVWREFQVGDSPLAVLKDIQLNVAAGEMIAIVDQPSRGSYQINGREVGSLQADELAALRREHFGFIFQRYHLLGDLSAAGT